MAWAPTAWAGGWEVGTVAPRESREGAPEGLRGGSLGFEWGGGEEVEWGAGREPCAKSMCGWDGGLGGSVGCVGFVGSADV